MDGLWVRHDRGTSHFLGRVEQTLTAGDGPFPLAYPGWLAAGEPDTTLTATTTAAVLGDAELWRHLDRFHRIILSCIGMNAAAAEHAERDRLRRRLEFERRLAHDTLSRLVTSWPRRRRARTTWRRRRAARPSSRTIRCWPRAGWWAPGRGS